MTGCMRLILSLLGLSGKKKTTTLTGKIKTDVLSFDINAFSRLLSQVKAVEKTSWTDEDVNESHERKMKRLKM